MVSDYQNSNIFSVGIRKYPAQIWEFSQTVGHFNEVFGKILSR